MKKISIIIPVYNTEKYLKRFFKSIISQTIFEDLELIIVNDGSKDESEKIINEYKRKYNNIIVIKQNNQGVSVARNNGLREATGKYIMFFDSDDSIENDYCEKMYDEIEDKNVDMIEADFFKVGLKKTKKRSILKKELNSNKFIMTNFFMGSIIYNNLFNKIFKREIACKIKFEEGKRVGEDMYYVFNYLLNCKKIYIDTEICGYNYYINDNSTMNSKFSEKFFDTIELSGKMIEHLKCTDLESYARAHYYYEVCKVIEYICLSQNKNEYFVDKKKLKKTLNECKGLFALKYLSRKNALTVMLMKFSEKLYMFVYKIKN